MSKEQLAQKVFDMMYEDYCLYMERTTEEWPSIEPDLKLLCENEGFTLHEIKDVINKGFEECLVEVMVEDEGRETEQQ